MSDLNMVILQGRLTKNAERSVCANGTVRVSFFFACGKSVKTKDGNWETKSSFFNAVYFGKHADWIFKDLTKGREVIIEGELKQNAWTDNNNKQHSTIELAVQNVRALRRPGEGKHTKQDDEVNTVPAVNTESAPPEDIPF